MNIGVSLLLSPTLWLFGLSTVTPGVMAGSISNPWKGQPARPATYHLEAETLVTAQRLDSAVALSFPLFDTSSILPGFDATTQGASNDVVLRHIVTTMTTISGTGETVAVTGLLAVPVSANNTIPVVSWQHGTILSFDQVPSHMVKLSDPNYNVTDDADSLETLFNIQRFAANRFAVIAADYIGKGPLREGRGEAYVVKGATTQTCVEFSTLGSPRWRILV